MFLLHYILFTIIASTARLDAETQTGNGYFRSDAVIQFNCVYNKSAFTFLHFSHNGTQLRRGGRYEIFESDDHHSLIISMTRQTDEGMYTCFLFSLEVQRALARHATIMYEG